MGMGWTFNNVVNVMRRCVGAVVLGFPRWRATISGSPIRMIGEFSHIEGAIALSLGLPTFIAAEPDLLDRGIIFKGGGFQIAPIPIDADRETIFTGSFGRAFDAWTTKLGEQRDIFLGFCSKSAGFAAQVEAILTRAGATVHNWAMDFGVGFSILEEIHAARTRCDRAVFIFSEDDPLEGTASQAAPRDNVVFEAGYFISARGPGNTLIIRVGNAKMPADLGGAIYLSIPSVADGPALIEARLRDFAIDGIL
ncbi:TIR domain-containing protein [Mycobacterium sp.]|uniref:TIR domain-containing protein n=1 Tax=Mycobacterium sp. TaxID=1785 RepID=UPI002DA49687|nr:TIR domain-containing protein [Mycobacterium sp.]